MISTQYQINKMDEQTHSVQQCL